MIGPEGVKVPEQTQALTGLGSKTVQDLIGADFKLIVEGTTVKASGEVKNIAEPWTEFDKTNNTGHFVPFQMPAALRGQKITLSGMAKDKTVTVDTDLLHIHRLENLTGDVLNVKKDGKLVMEVDFSGVTRAQ